MYSLSGLSLSVEICCVCVTVETGNTESDSHHVHSKSIQLSVEEQQLGKHFLTTMSDWAALLGLTSLTSVREREGGGEGCFWRTCFAALSVYETVTAGHTCEKQTDSGISQQISALYFLII